MAVKGKLSPMMQHYLSVKEKYGDAIVLYRLGDFYEMFFDDAKTASSVLELTLTGRDCGLEERAPMCGVPYHAVDSYISRLISAGYKVAICEQLTSPEESNGMVERDVVRVITPGTVVEDNILDEKKNNYLASVYSNGKKSAIAWADITTGEFNTIEFDDDISYLEDMLISVMPSEIICNTYLLDIGKSIPSVKMGKLPKFQAYYDWAYSYDNAVKKLSSQFHTENLQPFEIHDKRASISASGALLEYLSDTQKRALSHFDGVKYILGGSFMFLDSNTRRNLELTETTRDKKKKGSLLWVLDRTKTNMGARNIRKWLEQPLRNCNKINYRLDAVENIIKDNGMRCDLEQTLSTIRDMERLTGKIAYGSINPRDCLALADSLKTLPEIKRIISKGKAAYIKKLNDEIDPLTDLTKILDSAISPDAPMLLKDGGYIKDGFSEELDSYRNARKMSSKWLAEMEAREKLNSDIRNLKIGYNRIFGYFIEVPKASLDKVPYNYVRKQTLANCERYITEELKEIEDKLLGAEEKAIKLEAKIFDYIKNELSSEIITLKRIAKAIAELDTLYSLAAVAIERRYVKPTINDKVRKIDVKNGRHPVVEALLGDNEFVSNDTCLDNNKNRTMVITGPNMAGKSTYMRQVALITLMAHIGSFVPASSAEISMTDRIFTRVGASDDVAYGQSTFMVEMIEVATILRNATSDSLLILDEIGRGTSTYDGLSIAWAVMEYISVNIKAKTMFSTHYHELTELEGLIEGVKNYRILVNETENRVIFLHKITRGGTNKSFGIEVAALAGIPTNVTERAKEIAKRLEEVNLGRDSNSIVLSGKEEISKKNTEQLSFIENSVGNEIVGILKKTNVDNCTPIAALMLLTELKEKLR